MSHHDMGFDSHQINCFLFCEASCFWRYKHESVSSQRPTSLGRVEEVPASVRCQDARYAQRRSRMGGGVGPHGLGAGNHFCSRKQNTKNRSTCGCCVLMWRGPQPSDPFHSPPRPRLFLFEIHRASLALHLLGKHSIDTIGTVVL